MADKKSLAQLAEGDRAVVTRIKLAGPMATRLADLGLIPGTQVACIQKSPAGNPVAYRIRGALIALRLEDAAGVLVEA